MDFDRQALAKCDAEPIHIPGLVQQNGVLVAFDRYRMTISYVSENTEFHLGEAPETFFGRDAKELFGETITHKLRNVLQTPSALQRRIPVGRIDGRDSSLEIHAFVSGDYLVVELEPASEVPWSDADLSAQIGELFQEVNAQTTVDALLQTSVRWLEMLSGYDRVMIYRFNEDWSGEVIAERNNSEHQDFLHLRFPRWDIPTQAREIMTRLPLRMITDTRAEPARILAADASLPPLDISIAHLRGVSPIHLQYLHNMEVEASMTLSVVVEGTLWGLISFHNYEPMVPSPRLRAIAVPFIEYFNVKLAQLMKAEAVEAREAARNILESIRRSHGDGAELATLILGDPMPLQEQFDAQGMAIFLSGNWQVFGRTVSAKDIEPLLMELYAKGGVVARDALESNMQVANWEEQGLAGALAISLGGEDVAVIFREAIEAEVKWAGSPSKDLVRDGASYRLSPRGSFELYVETVKHRSRPWRPIDLELAEGLAALFLQSEQQRQRVERQFYEDRDRQQRLMINELNHRVRNILALIRSVSRQARNSNASLDSYSAALEHRIKALAVAHDLSNDTSLTSVSLAGIMSTELAPYAEKDAARFRLSGPDKAIRPDLCPIFALVVHELSTNAAKYGALSVPDGFVEITFEAKDEGLDIHWVEIGGPPVKAPLEYGFGTVLIQNAIPFELDGHVEMNFFETGVDVRMWLPGEVLSSSQGGPAPYVTQFPDRAGATAPLGSDLGTVLLVEDNYAIALDAEKMLQDLGFGDVLIASSVKRALKLLNQSTVRVAVLDMHLGSETSFPVARETEKRGIPAIFATGYGSDIGRPPGLEHIPLVTKPVELSTLAEVIARLLSEHDAERSA